MSIRYFYTDFDGNCKQQCALTVNVSTLKRDATIFFPRKVSSTHHNQYVISQKATHSKLQCLGTISLPQVMFEVSIRPD
jgi:hypothetical protein